MSKAVRQGRLSTIALEYGENAPVGAVCCGACRTRASANIVALALAVAVGAAAGVARTVKRLRQL